MNELDQKVEKKEEFKNELATLDGMLDKVGAEDDRDVSERMDAGVEGEPEQDPGALLKPREELSRWLLQ